MIDEAMPLPGLGAPAAATVSTIRPMPNAQNTTRPGDFSLPGLSAAMPAPTLPPPSSMQMQMPPLPGMPQPTMMQPQQQQMAPSALPGMNPMPNMPYGMPPPNQSYGPGAGAMPRQNNHNGPPLGFMPPPQGQETVAGRRGGPLPSQEQMLQQIGYEPPQWGGNRGRRR
jgi:hypothetical protein